jgi:hypothetical protein
MMARARIEAMIKGQIGQPAASMRANTADVLVGWKREVL